jgi:hypothetical protein
VTAPRGELMSETRPTYSGRCCRECSAPATVLITSPVPMAAVCDAHAPAAVARPDWETIATRYRAALEQIMAVETGCTVDLDQLQKPYGGVIDCPDCKTMHALANAALEAP